MFRKLLCLGAIGAMMGRHHWKHGGGGPFDEGFWRSGRRERTRRGDIKFQILEVLAAKARHGYDVIRDLEERHGGVYRPSPGSVYPTLQMLEDGGYVTSEMVDGKKVYTITSEGRQLLDQRPAAEPLEQDAMEDIHSTRQSAMKLAGAVMQALRGGDGRVRARVKAVLDRARKEIYGLLADEGDDD